jgi:hypothetical protein
MTPQPPNKRYARTYREAVFITIDDPPDTTKRPRRPNIPYFPPPPKPEQKKDDEKPKEE